MVLAGNITPIDVITHIPILCEEKDIPYIYVPAKEHLGESILVCWRLCVNFSACVGWRRCRTLLRSVLAHWFLTLLQRFRASLLIPVRCDGL